MDRIYLDNGATSFPKAPGLGQVMADYLEKKVVNINRTESFLSEEAFDFLFELRMNLCELYHFPTPESVIFTRCITESLNWIIKGLLKKGDHVVVSSLEHNAVMRPLVQMEIDYTQIPSDSFGYAIPSRLEEVCRKDTKAMILSVASNVFGTLQDVYALAKEAKRLGLLLILDTAQASPLVSLDNRLLQADAICFTGHKFFLGPQGTGGFLLRKDLALTMDPLIAGGTGSQSDSILLPTTLPDRLSSGTENLVGLCGLNHSVKYVMEHLEELREKTRRNTVLLYRGLETIPYLRIVGPTLDMPRTDVISVVSEKVDVAWIAAELLEKGGVETRVGMHCAPCAHKAMGTFPQGTLRFSPGPFSTEDEIWSVLRLLDSLPI